AASDVYKRQDEVRQWLRSFEQQLFREINDRITDERQRTDWLRARLRHPGERLQEQSQRLDELELRLVQNTRIAIKTARLQLASRQAELRQHSPEHTLARYRDRLQQISERLKRLMRDSLSSQQIRLQNITQSLDVVSPLATLSRGYGIVSRADDGTLVRSHLQVQSGDRVTTLIGEGLLECTVDSSLPAKK
ncbi:MAG: exodeoxyribonuclease VII large subunit, partial [Proteobacteria bacterium]|nr:exodeoxyribonuclease VII large subunit [Pseudomonadota bacterium]